MTCLPDSLQLRAGDRYEVSQGHPYYCAPPGGDGARGVFAGALVLDIVELLEAGTRWIWVVRLVGPRRVEVHSSGAPMTVVGPGEVLEAPGVLRNAVPVEALYERGAAHEVALRNLLQRSGYVDLDAVGDEGREEGHAEGREKGREEGREVARRLLVELVLRHAWSARVSTAANAFDLLGDAPD